MSLFLTLAFLFCIGSSAGWLLEVIFRRFYSKSNPERKWINPGFLTGPWLPLYGFGLCLLFLLAGLERYFAIDGWLAKAVLFLIMAISMTAIEYLAGLISIKLLKVRLWDYSNEWGNVNGIVCPLFSAFWALLGAIYYFLIHPNVLDALRWLSENLAFSFVIGLYFGIFSVDVFHSCNILAKIKSFAEEQKITVRYDRLRRIMIRAAEKRKNRKIFFLPIHYSSAITEQLKDYNEWLKNQAGASDTNNISSKK